MHSFVTPLFFFTFYRNSYIKYFVSLLRLFGFFFVNCRPCNTWIHTFISDTIFKISMLYLYKAQSYCNHLTSYYPPRRFQCIFQINAKFSTRKRKSTRITQSCLWTNFYRKCLRLNKHIIKTSIIHLLRVRVWFWCVKTETRV